MKTVLMVMALTGLSLALPAHAGRSDDEAAIRQVASDYLASWYAGDGKKMATTLHPKLVKRTLPAAPGAAVVDTNADALVAATKAGDGKPAAGEKPQPEVNVLDVYGNAAVAKVTGTQWIEYLQLGRIQGQWKIINVMYGARQ
ncbi:hypothetical protein JHS3_08340 [Jeongeupia sp. HS-3]|uniref:nuclear transport factor 2 family protein n=1 Tax=Jeongeupia sp. HS-3 TaxID=1009682 RepID=UPI0018A51633|nr:nuclear transport factor 2 family protein [Jeongeupia sp. HS-3]BCL75098.1 hypothetical protein JHS3_08340 [Jeongeupia sp. HS-3]